MKQDQIDLKRVKEGDVKVDNFSYFIREPTRRTTGFPFPETLDRRRNVQPPQINPATNPILPTREADRLQPEREFWPVRKTSQDREEENLNEISFGTRRGVETETDNIFVDSDTARQGRAI